MAKNVSLSPPPPHPLKNSLLLDPPKRKSDFYLPPPPPPLPPRERSNPPPKKRLNGTTTISTTTTKENSPTEPAATPTHPSTTAAAAAAADEVEGGGDRDRKVEEEVERTTTVEPSLDEIIERFETMTKEAGKVQREVLKKILEQNKDTEYLRRFGLDDGRTDPESFTARVPLATYADLRPYVDRIFNGEKAGVLTSKPVSALSLSSGTSEGKPKRVPFTEEMIDAYVESMITSYAYRNREYPIDETKMSLQFVYSSKKTTTPNNLQLGLVSSHITTHPKFPTSYRTHLCSPDEALTAPDLTQSLYSHLLMALKHSTQIQYIYSVFSHTLLTALRSLTHLHPDLTTDISLGYPNPTRIPDPSLRAALTARLAGPDPTLAREIHLTCTRLAARGWEAMVPALFPEAKYLLSVVTGSAVEHYLGRIRFYAGSVPLKGVDYGATEGWVGTNVRPSARPEDICFVPLPDIAYFEFIPLEGEGEGDGKGSGKPVGLTEVKVGRMYEIVFTNFQGMYRYRLGDWVKVTGFYNAAPELKYVCRGNVVLSINIDKTTEKDLQSVVEAATAATANVHLELVDFTSQAVRTPGDEHYVIYWELATTTTTSSEEEEGVVLQRCCSCMDASFQDLGYVSSRRCGEIRALELRVVESGTFEKVADYYTSSASAAATAALGASSGVQFKMPRCVKNEAVIRILEGCVIKRYFSTAYDQ